MTPHVRITSLVAGLALLLLAAPSAGAQGSVYWYSTDAAGGGYDAATGFGIIASVGQSAVAVVTTTETFFSAGFVVPPFAPVAPPNTARLALSAMALDFHDVPVTTTSEQSVVVTNTGLTDLIITRQRLGGADSTEFGIPQGAAATIPPNGSSTMRIAHTPCSVGAKTAFVRIECNDPSRPVAFITLTARGIATGAADAEAPLRIDLGQAYPNPLRRDGGVSCIPYTLDREAAIELTVLDPVGRAVAVLARGMRGPGTHVERFQPAAGLPSGAYVLVLRAATAGGVASLARMLILFR
jgi:hypothetical protein